jgi:hypothetical protein
MKRLLLVLIVLFGVQTALATSLDAPTFDAVLLNALFTPSGGQVRFFLTSARGDEAQRHSLNFTGVDVLSLTCGNASCTRFNSEIMLSGFRAEPEQGGTYFLGSLDFVSTRFSVTVDGTLIACSNPTCSSGELFIVDVHTHGFPVIVATDTNGTLSLVSARDVVPEPSTVGLVGTGFTFLVGVLRKRLLA